jgi:type IX secretion system PorP/SprF family membrane protein
MKKFILSLISLFFIISSSQSQYDAQFSQNMGFLSVGNPAMISIDGYAKVLGVLRQQWVGLKNSPSTFVLNMTVPLNTGAVTHGAGILFFNDKVGLFANKSVFLQYAYQRHCLMEHLSRRNIRLLNNSFEVSKAFIPKVIIMPLR